VVVVMLPDAGRRKLSPVPVLRVMAPKLSVTDPVVLLPEITASPLVSVTPLTVWVLPPAPPIIANVPPGLLEPPNTSPLLAFKIVVAAPAALKSSVSVLPLIVVAPE
jgi:hypothetical protein